MGAKWLNIPCNSFTDVKKSGGFNSYDLEGGIFRCLPRIALVFGYVV